MLDSIIRREINIERWKDSPDLVDRVLVHLNNLHRGAGLVLVGWVLAQCLICAIWPLMR